MTGLEHTVVVWSNGQRGHAAGVPYPSVAYRNQRQLPAWIGPWTGCQ